MLGKQEDDSIIERRLSGARLDAKLIGMAA